MITEMQPNDNSIVVLWAKAQRAGITRRKFILLLAAGGAASVLSACTNSVNISPTITSLTPAKVQPSTSPTTSTVTSAEPNTTSSTPVTKTEVPPTNSPSSTTNTLPTIYPTTGTTPATTSTTSTTTTAIPTTTNSAPNTTSITTSQPPAVTSITPIPTPMPTPPQTTFTAPSGVKVGLLKYEPRAWPGYTLFAPKHYTHTYLINNQGRQVHEWTKGQYEPGQSCYLRENGHLVRAAMTKGPLSTGGGEGGRIEEYDWDSNLVWELDFSTDKYMQHHDFCILPNGNIIMLVVEKKTYDEAIAAGFDPSKLALGIRSSGYMVPDAVYEVKPTLPKGCEVVWKWSVWDHLIQDFASSKANYGNVAAHPELVDPNGDGKQIPAFWNHMNSITYHTGFDQIMLSVRGQSEVWIIDHSTTIAQAAGHTGGKYNKGGDLLYRWGNPRVYQAGIQNDEKLFQQHNATWIESNCPGAGDILCFNNGLGRNYSTVDQWTPPVDAMGNYRLTSGSAFGPKEFTWTYRANPPTSMYDEAISGAQRLPNGNTLIDSGTHGRFIEVTPQGETVWEYINPVVTDGPLGRGSTIPEDKARPGEFMNAVFRVLRYSLDFPAFSARNLNPVGPIEK